MADEIHIHDNGAVLQILSDMKNDMNRNFDLLVAGQKTLYTKLDAHEAEDNKRFEEIHIKAAVDAGEAKATAKLWAAGGAIGTLLTGGGFEYLKHYFGWK